MNDVNWTDVAAEDFLVNDDVVGLVVAGLDIALYKVEGEVFATANVCTHGPGRLCDGFLIGHEIECPLHQGRFDVRDGSATCEPATAAVKTYPVRLSGNRVWIRI